MAIPPKSISLAELDERLRQWREGRTRQGFEQLPQQGSSSQGVTAARRRLPRERFREMMRVTLGVVSGSVQLRIWPMCRVSLLDLPEDLLQTCLTLALGPLDTFRLGCVSRAFAHLHSARVWRLFLECTFGEMRCVRAALTPPPPPPPLEVDEPEGLHWAFPEADEPDAAAAARAALEAERAERERLRALFVRLAYDERAPGLGCPLLADPDEDGSLPIAESGCGGSLVLRALGRRGANQRCPCVVSRTPQLPLVMASLHRRRAGASALGGGGFMHLLRSLRARFDLDLRQLDELSDASLAAVDVLVLASRVAPSETAAVRRWVRAGGALIGSVAPPPPPPPGAGAGAAAATLAAPHDDGGDDDDDDEGLHAASAERLQPLSWLGVRTIRHANTLPLCAHQLVPAPQGNHGPGAEWSISELHLPLPPPPAETHPHHHAWLDDVHAAADDDAATEAAARELVAELAPDAAAAGGGAAAGAAAAAAAGDAARRAARLWREAERDEAVEELTSGPFGAVSLLLNRGECVFELNELASAAGAVQLSHVTLPGSLRLLSTLALYPPQRGGLTGAGRVLACSSLHWLADATHWGGGLWRPTRFDLPRRLAGIARRDCPNGPLLLNFVAGAVAARRTSLSLGCV